LWKKPGKFNKILRFSNDATQYIVASKP
jgi:hypothetical protein